MQQPLTAVLAVLAVAGCGQALECYSCQSKSVISGLTVASNVLTGLKKFPPCDEFDPVEPQKKFVQQCPILVSKGCAKFVDPNDSSNVMRSCFLIAKNECMDGACYCSGNLCNGQQRAGAPAAALLVALGTALLLGR